MAVDMSPDPTGPARSAGAAAGAQVELTLSVADDLLALARLTVSAVASRAGFDVEEIEDLRLAVDELCLQVLQGRRSGRLVLAMAGASTSGAGTRAPRTPDRTARTTRPTCRSGSSTPSSTSTASSKTTVDPVRT